MVTIDGHTFDETLTSNGWVIDAGCRGFAFSANFRKVYSIDIEYLNTSIIDNQLIKHKFKQAALSHEKGFTEAYLFGNGTANFIKGINGVPGNTEDRPVKTEVVKMITLDDIYKEIGTDIDLLKLDIEGSEYGILLSIADNPIPKQITVEMHEHVHPDLHNRFIDEVMEKLCKHYHCNLYIREWPRYKFMDCLFIRKDLL